MDPHPETVVHGGTHGFGGVSRRALTATTAAGLALLLTYALAGCAPADRVPVAQAPPDGIPPESGAPPTEAPLNLLDLVPRTATAAALRERFAASEVVEEAIYLGEGQSARGTVLFPSDPSRRVEILWRDPATRSRPEWVRINGTSSVWSVPPGISLGVKLDSVEALNGGPFELLGFSWDYEGTVNSWEEGQLASLMAPGRTVSVRFTPSSGAEPGDVDPGELLGETVFRSDDPRMRALNPRIYEVMILYDGAGS